MLTSRSSRGAFRHRLAKLGLKTTHVTDDAAWERFQEVAGTKKEVTDEDLHQIVASAEGSGCNVRRKCTRSQASTG